MIRSLPSRLLLPCPSIGTSQGTDQRRDIFGPTTRKTRFSSTWFTSRTQSPRPQVHLLSKDSWTLSATRRPRQFRRGTGLWPIGTSSHIATCSAIRSVPSAATTSISASSWWCPSISRSVTRSRNQPRPGATTTACIRPRSSSSAGGAASTRGRARSTTPAPTRAGPSAGARIPASDQAACEKLHTKCMQSQAGAASGVRIDASTRLAVRIPTGGRPRDCPVPGVVAAPADVGMAGELTAPLSALRRAPAAAP